MKKIIELIEVTCNRCRGGGEDEDNAEFFSTEADLLASRTGWLSAWQWSDDGETPEICGRCVGIERCEARGHQFPEWMPCVCATSPRMRELEHRCRAVRWCENCPHIEGKDIPSPSDMVGGER